MNNLPEKILNIEEVFNVEGGGMDGYKVTTDKQEILVLISNDQSCCENWGYFSSHDEEKDFVGAMLTGISLVDNALDVKKFNETLDYGLDEGDVQFVNFETDKGTLQLAVYNSHNGYYGHSILIKSNQVTKNGSL